MTDRFTKLRDRLTAPIDNASLAFLRIGFGAMMVWEVWRHFQKGWILSHFTDHDFHFKYYGFGWVHDGSQAMMTWFFLALGVVSAMLMVGFLTRIAAALFFVGFTWVFLIDQTEYLNHFYLISLLGLLFIVVPCDGTASVDARLWPRLRTSTAPAWALYTMQAQIGLVYFFGGIAKLGSDWLIRGEPMRMWLGNRTGFHLLGDHHFHVGRFFDQEWFVYTISWGGMLLDLFIVPLLLWKRTRIAAFILVVGFHITNSWLFSIGVFPWLAIAATTIYFEPKWPRRIFNLPVHEPTPNADAASERGTPAWLPKAVAVFLIVHFTLQVFMPLRHWLYPGSPHWTEEGHRFAWHMKLRSKRGQIRFHVTDPATGATRVVNPRSFLAPRQVSKMATHPDMILQAAHYIADTQTLKDRPRLEVRAECRVSLNDRPMQPYIDPTVDLAAVRRTLWHCDWVLPMEPDDE